MAETLKEAKARTKDAWQRRIPYETQLKDIYRYMMPYREPAGHLSQSTLGNRTEGDSRTDLVFDGTAVNAVYRFTGRMQTNFSTIFEPFIDLQAGPLMPDGDEKNNLTAELQKVSHIVNGVIGAGQYHLQSQGMYADLYAGTGAMFMPEGDDTDICRFRNVPIAEIALDEGPFGDIWGVDWRRSMRAAHLKTSWPKGEFSKTMLDRMTNAPRDPVIVHQNTLYDPGEQKWCFKVWCEHDGDDALVWEEDFRSNPWLTPRFFVVPGEVYGRGPAHLGLPYAKTLNKVRELALLAAAFSVMGLWTRRNDGVFNPDMAVFEPLAMWQVASNGGSLGPSLQRLDVPHNFDVSSFVIQDERAQMQEALLDKRLPPMEGAVRSPTEIIERMKDINEDLAGVFPRLSLEIARPMAQRVIDLLQKRKLLNTNIKIDQLLTQVRVVSPIAAGQQAAKAKAAVDWAQTISLLFGQEAALMMINAEQLGPDIGRWLGVGERHIRTEADRKKLMKMVAEIIAKQNQAAAPADQPAPGAKYVNGGAM